VGLLLVEQNLGVATEVCGTVAVMVNGRIAAAMPSRALLEDEAEIEIVGEDEDHVGLLGG